MADTTVGANTLHPTGVEVLDATEFPGFDGTLTRTRFPLYGVIAGDQRRTWAMTVQVRERRPDGRGTRPVGESRTLAALRVPWKTIEAMNAALNMRVADALRPGLRPFPAASQAEA